MNIVVMDGGTDSHGSGGGAGHITQPDNGVSQQKVSSLSTGMILQG